MPSQVVGRCMPNLMLSLNLLGGICSRLGWRVGHLGVQKGVRLGNVFIHRLYI